MSKGRRPLPTKTKELKGTLRKSRTNPKEPKVKPKFPKPPRGMGKGQKAIWRNLGKLIDPLRVASASDQATLALLVKALDRLNRAYAELAEAGEYLDIETRYGNITRVHPAMMVVEHGEKFCLRVLVEFGLTPAARSKVDAKDQGDKEDPKGKILKFIRGGASASR